MLVDAFFAGNILISWNRFHATLEKLLGVFGFAVDAMDWTPSEPFTLSFQNTEQAQEEAMNLESNVEGV